jgi:hypothetical protein
MKCITSAEKFIVAMAAKHVSREVSTIIKSISSIFSCWCLLFRIYIAKAESCLLFATLLACFLYFTFNVLPMFPM